MSDYSAPALVSVPDGCNCVACPLKGQKPVLGYHPANRIKARGYPLIVAESPGHHEVLSGEPLIGASGRLLKQSLARFGVSLQDCVKTNAVLCRPPEKLKPAEWKKALECCRPRLHKELMRYAGDGSPVILALGAKALQTLTGHAKIMPWVGAPLETTIEGATFTVLASMHPAAALRKPALMPVLRMFVQRALMLAAGKLPAWKWCDGFHLPREVPGTYFTKDPNHYRAILKSLSEQKLPIGVDVETAGLDPFSAPLLCVGLVNELNGLVLEFPIKDLALLAAVKDLMANSDIKKVMHNGQHDVLSLESNGFIVNGFDFDTLLAHSIVAPELPHDLGFVATTEFHAPRWKTEFRVESDSKGQEAFTKRDKGELYHYNVKDSYVTAILQPKLQKRIDSTHRGQELFDNLMHLSSIAMRMRRVGACIDTSKFDVHRQRLSAEMDQQQQIFLQLTAGKYRLGKSGQHGDLKKLYFKELGFRPLHYSKETGEPKLDFATLQEYFATGDKSSQAITDAILRFRKASKLRSTYVDGLPIDSKNEIHSIWKCHGAVTGRWASVQCNMQNVPLVMRDLVIAPPGKWIVGADFSSLELRIVALLTQDALFLKWYENDIDVHRQNASMIFNIDPSAVTKPQRQAAKKLAFGFNYSTSDDVRTVWQALRTEFPDISMRQVQYLRKRWFEIHPALALWQRRVIAETEKTKYVEETFSGRRIYFHDGVVDANRAVNFGIQGLAGTITNRAMAGLSADIDWVDTTIMAQVHDAIYCVTSDKEATVKLLHKHMVQELEYNGYKMRFTIEVSAGKNWKDLEDV